MELALETKILGSDGFWAHLLIWIVEQRRDLAGNKYSFELAPESANRLHALALRLPTAAAQDPKHSHQQQQPPAAANKRESELLAEPRCLGSIGEADQIELGCSRGGFGHRE